MKKTISEWTKCPALIRTGHGSQRPRTHRLHVLSSWPQIPIFYDNDSNHRAKVISEWFHEHDNEFTGVQRPSQSAYLNRTNTLGMWQSATFAWTCKYLQKGCDAIKPGGIHDIKKDIKAWHSVAFTAKCVRVHIIVLSCTFSSVMPMQ